MPITDGFPSNNSPQYSTPESAHYILGPFGEDSDLRRWGLKLSQRGGKNARKRQSRDRKRRPYKNPLVLIVVFVVLHVLMLFLLLFINIGNTQTALCGQMTKKKHHFPHFFVSKCAFPGRHS